MLRELVKTTILEQDLGPTFGVGGGGGGGSKTTPLFEIHKKNFIGVF